MTLDHSWASQIVGGGLSFSPHWPYAPRRLILEPDFTNRTNSAEQYADPFSLAVFTKYLLAAADEMEEGLESYRQAAFRAEPSKMLNAYRQVLLAEQLQRMMRSAQAVLEFEDLRFRLSAVSGAVERERLLARMEIILRQEIARTQDALDASLRDSRLGYEWEQDYVYTPRSLREKLQQMQSVLDIEIPRHRKLTNETPPVPNMLGPARPISTTSTSKFTLRSDGASAFECRLDDEPFGECPNPHTIGVVVADGPHTLHVRAKNAAGNVSPAASYSWIIDTQPPEPLIQRGPRQPATNDRNATFVFAAMKPGVSFECRLSGEAAFRACNGEHTIANLADGTHVLLVNAVDAFGRTSPAPKSYIWAVDTVPPTGTMVTQGPIQPLGSDASSSFIFTSSDANDAFECKLTIEPGFGPCLNPHRMAPLPPATYTLLVRAKDAAGNVDLSPASYSWTVQDGTAVPKR